ncbi:10 kDa heat shock protein, mitochondrial-like [Montipora capricornis]|uniref:10 kDa heat shock protein, mitochondrial-like n=1 Tax=Montipora foliosa TaxID=591990 RepID=UPI0035F17253
MLQREFRLSLGKKSGHASGCIWQALMRSEILFHVRLQQFKYYRGRLRGFHPKMAGIRKFKPLFDRIVVEKFLPEVKTKGGVLLPEKGQGKVLEGTVIAVGPGTKDKTGNVIPVSVTVGDKVLLPEYGGTKISMEEKEYHIYRDGDILGVFE